jgi:prepilin-type N-terminal cleavage/methylation domain-containing protein
MSVQSHGLASRKAFTLIELITVIAVMGILVAIGIPAFRAALASSNKALSESQFRIGMETARQLAIQNSSRDAAAVFFYEPGGRLTIVPCLYVGTILDWKDPAQNNPGDDLVERDVFVPVPEIAPVQMPRGWVVRGYAGAGTLHDDLPGRDNANGWYEPTPARDFEAGTGNSPLGNWVFPETGFYPNASNVDTLTLADAPIQGTKRQTFLVRYRAGTGNVDPSESRQCIVIDPAPSQVVNGAGTVSDWRDGLTGVQANYTKIAAAEDRQRVVKQMLTSQNFNADTVVDAADDDARRDFLGNVSSDTVLCHPVTELALYREQSLATALGANGVNAKTGCLYKEILNANDGPEIDTALWSGGAPSTDIIARDINLWLTGKLQVGGPGPNNEFIESDAKLFSIDRYLGQGRKLGDDREVTP